MPSKPQLNHDDYCRIVGRVVIDTFLRIEHLEQQSSSLYEGFQSQLETLRTQLAEANSRIAELGQGRSVVSEESIRRLKEELDRVKSVPGT